MTPMQAKLPEGSNVLDYGRLSRDEDKDLNSLTNQMDILRDYGIKNGYNIVSEYFDDNVSGMTFDREGLDKMLDKIEEHGNIQAIIVKDAYVKPRLKNQQLFPPAPAGFFLVRQSRR